MNLRPYYLHLIVFALSSSPSMLYSQRISPDYRAETIDNIDIGYGLAIGDVDGDSLPDILLADQKQFVWYRNGDWKSFVMAENLTKRDNVCIAAHDINGDGQVEVAVGAQWNPGETSDTAASGSVHYLIRPENPQQAWQPVPLHHEPTIHRMQWMAVAPGQFQLVVVPLHGRGNRNGQGKGVKVMAYQPPNNPKAKWDTVTVDRSMHMTHNLEIGSGQAGASSFFVAGKEGVTRYDHTQGGWQADRLPQVDQPAGEVRLGYLGDSSRLFMATIEPMHGNQLVVYQGKDFRNRALLTDDLAEGHALACADLLGLGRDQIVVGWREPNAQGKVGIRIFVPVDTAGDGWMHYLIDDNGMACEDLKVADLDMDGDLDIIAAGRATKNLKIYWNQLKPDKRKAD